MMSKVAVVYWSGTGNTESPMAQKVVKAPEKRALKCLCFTAADFNADRMDQFDVVAFGCPLPWGEEQLRKASLSRCFPAVNPSCGQKRSHCWLFMDGGDGEWMRHREETCASDGAVMASDSVICNESPDDIAQMSCAELGKALVRRRGKIYRLLSQQAGGVPACRTLSAGACEESKIACRKRPKEAANRRNPFLHRYLPFAKRDKIGCHRGIEKKVGQVDSWIRCRRTIS